MRVVWSLMSGVLASTLASETALAADATAYRYDVSGRLIEASVKKGSQNCVTTTYSLDAASNRTMVAQSEAPSSIPTPAPTATPGNVTDYSFGQPDVGGSFQYDPSVGNACFGGGAGIQTNGSAWAFATAPEAGQAGFVQNDKDGNGNSSVVVVNVCNLTVGATYVVRFRTAKRLTADPTNTIHVAISGRTGANLGFYAPSSTDWQPVVSGTFTGDNDAMALSFTGKTAKASTGTDLVTPGSP